MLRSLLIGLMWGNIHKVHTVHNESSLYFQKLLNTSLLNVESVVTHFFWSYNVTKRIKYSGSLTKNFIYCHRYVDEISLTVRTNKWYMNSFINYIMFTRTVWTVLNLRVKNCIFSFQITFIFLHSLPLIQWTFSIVSLINGFHPWSAVLESLQNIHLPLLFPLYLMQNDI